MTRIRPKPWWLEAFTQPYQWVSLAGTIYHPEDIEPYRWPTLIAHESVHLEQQQRDGLFRFLWRYLTNPHARLEYEAEAIAVEVSQSNPAARAGLIDWYAQALAGKPYRHAASSPMAALDSITRHMTTKGNP